MLEISIKVFVFYIHYLFIMYFLLAVIIIIIIKTVMVTDSHYKYNPCIYWWKDRENVFTDHSPSKIDAYTISKIEHFKRISYYVLINDPLEKYEKKPPLFLFSLCRLQTACLIIFQKDHQNINYIISYCYNS